MKIIMCAVTLLSVLAVLLIPAYTGNVFDWATVPLVNWLRYVASVLLAMLLPGYYLLKILDQKNSLNFSATVPLAFVFSLLITFLIGFSQLLIGNSISLSANFSLLVINIVLMAIYFVRSLPSFSMRSQVTVKISPVEIGAVFCMLAVVFVGNIYVMNNTMPLSMGDMWDHLSQTLQYSQGFPIHEGLLYSYPYLFHVWLATFFQVSGLPSLTSYQALFAISFIPVLSFYPFIKEWFSEKKLRSVALLLVPLLGFGSLYALDLKIQDPSLPLFSVISSAVKKTYDISDISILSSAQSNVVPLIFIALPTLFLFLYLLKRNMPDITKSLFCAVLVAVSFLGHVDTSFFMGLALFLYVTIVTVEGTKAVALGGFLGLFIVFVVDFIAPANVYVLGAGGVISNNTMAFLATFFFFILSYLVSLFKRRFHLSLNFLSNSIKKSSLHRTELGILFLYIFALIVWLYVLPNYDAIQFGHYNFTPSFVWPIRFGAIGLFAILCLSLYLKDVIKDRRLTFFLAIALTGFVLEQFANYYPIYPAYRFATFTLIGVIALAAFFVVNSLSFFAKKKRIVFGTLLLLIMIPGMLATSLGYYDRALLKPAINNYELDALNFVEKNLPSNSSVVTFTSDSATKLETFAGISTIRVLQTWDYILLNKLDPSTLLYLLETSNVKYIYLTALDFQKLSASSNLLFDLLSSLTIPFQNSDITIYAVPQIAAPSLQSNIVILNPLNPDATDFEQSLSYSELALQTVPGLLDLNYTISSIPVESKKQNIILENLTSSQWSITEGSAKIDKSENATVRNLTADKNGYFATSSICHYNLTQFDGLNVFMKVSDDTDGELKFIIRDSYGAWTAWLISDFPKNEWFTLTLPLAEPTLKSSFQLDLSEIRILDVGFQGLNPNRTYSSLEVGSVYGVSSLLSLPYAAANSLLGLSSTIVLTHDPDFNANSLVQLAENGKNIVVFNTADSSDGFFFKFLQLSSTGYVEGNALALSTTTEFSNSKIPSIVTNSSNISCIYDYKSDGVSVAPFVMVGKVGLGTITYVVLPSEIITNLAASSQLTTVFNEIVMMQQFSIGKRVSGSNVIGSYNTLEEQITLNGTIEARTENLLNIKPILTSKIEVQSGGVSTILLNASINSLKIYGSAQLIINNQSVTVQANSVSSYLTLFSNDSSQPCLLDLSNDSVAELGVVSLGESSTLTLHGGQIMLAASQFEFLLRNPSITVKGDAFFESARIQYSNPYIPLAGVVRSNLKISGQTSFTVLYTIKDVMLITNFSYVGVTSTILSQSSSVPDLSWLDLILSPVFFVFCLILIVLVLYLLMRKHCVSVGVQNAQEFS